MLELSIIIPVFNVECYVAQCLDSVFNQDLSEDEYEVICVNDGSTDGSRDVVASYLPLHRNLRLIDHPHNMKLGVARNTGRKAARGKYIWNVDSDDYIKPNCLKSLICECEKENLDILIFNFYHLSEIGKKENKARDGVNADCSDGTDFILGNSSIIGEFSPVWTQIYRKKFLDENDIFSPPINAGEDVPFTCRALCLAERVKFLNRHCYFYRSNPSSIGGEIESDIKAISLYEKCLVSSRYVNEIIRRDVRVPSVKLIYASIIKYILHWLPEYYLCLSGCEEKEFKRLCRRNIRKDKCLLKYMGKKMALKYCVRIINPL